MVERIFERILRGILGHPWAAACSALLLATLGASQAAKIPLRLSVIELLPEDRPSVRDFNEVMEVVGGVGYLGVIVGPAARPEQSLQKVMHVLRARQDLLYAFDEREAYLLDDRALYLLPRADFDELLDSTDTLLFEGRPRGLLDLDLETQEEREESVARARAFIARIRRDYGVGLTTTPTSAAARRYFLSQDGRYAMAFAKPTFDSEDLGRGIVLVEEVRRALETALPDVPVQLWGRYVNQVHDTAQIRHDIALTSVVGLGMILGVLVLGLGSVRSALAAVGCVVLSMGWTVGFTHFVIERINIVTGFLLAILGGLGVEYGVHLVRRFQQERRAGAPREASIETSFFLVGRALLSAALTSAGAFVILGLSDFRGYSELGEIAGFGVLAIDCVYMLCFPLVARILPDQTRLPRLREMFGCYPFTRRSGWLLPFLFLGGAYGLSRASLDLDFDRLRELSTETIRLNRFVSDLNSGRSMTPAALLTRNQSEADEVRAFLSDVRFRETIRESVALSTLVPRDQAERDERLEPYRKRIARLSDETLRAKVGMDPERLRAWMARRPYTDKDLPESLRQPFGPEGNVVLAYPTQALGQTRALRQFASVLLAAKMRYPGVRLGTDAVVLVEIVDYVLHDGKLVLCLFLVGAFIVLWIDFSSVEEALGLEAQLILGMLLLVSLMGLFNQPFTILNVAMIPAVVAAGIDMGVHVRHRELENASRSSLAAARFVAQAVQLGALTTLLGFGALFFAEASMLKGIAWVSCLGQAAMYLVCMVLWPVSKDLLGSALRRPSIRE